LPLDYDLNEKIYVDLHREVRFGAEEATPSLEIRHKAVTLRKNLAFLMCLSDV